MWTMGCLSWVIWRKMTMIYREHTAYWNGAQSYSQAHTDVLTHLQARKKMCHKCGATMNDGSILYFFTQWAISHFYKDAESLYYAWDLKVKMMDQLLQYKIKSKKTNEENCQTGDMLSSEPMVAQFTNTCVTWPQWVKLLATACYKGSRS